MLGTGIGYMIGIGVRIASESALFVLVSTLLDCSAIACGIQ
jgi:hypothetical protein